MNADGTNSSPSSNTRCFSSDISESGTVMSSEGALRDEPSSRTASAAEPKKVDCISSAKNGSQDNGKTEHRCSRDDEEGSDFSHNQYSSDDPGFADVLGKSQHALNSASSQRSLEDSNNSTLNDPKSFDFKSILQRDMTPPLERNSAECGDTQNSKTNGQQKLSTSAEANSQQESELVLSGDQTLTSLSLDISNSVRADLAPHRTDRRGSGTEKPRDGGTSKSEHQKRRDNRSSNRRLCACLPLRFVVVWTVFVGMVIVNAMRTNVGVTVLTILDKQSQPIVNNTGLARQIPDINWNIRSIGFLHSVFYLGYLITHLPAGYLTTRLPSHKLFGLCILISCTLNMGLPLAFQFGGYIVTMTLRFVQGLSEGLLYPACYGILRHWSTPPERGRVGSLVLTGLVAKPWTRLSHFVFLISQTRAYLGPVLGFPLCGVITDYMGWQYIYYINGIVGVMYVLLWLWLSEEKPAYHKQISSDELQFIEDLQGSERIDYEDVRIPWEDILTSLPVVSLCLCNIARNWVFVLMLTNEPFYLSMFHFSVAENGAFSALPHVFKISASLISGLLADFLHSRHLMTTTHIRKLLTAGFGVQAIFFALLTLTEDGTVAMVLLVLSVGFGGFVVSGWQLNHYDLSARHASVLVAVTSTFGNIASVTAPIVTGMLTEYQTFEGWNGVFYITSGIAGLACLSFLVFGSGDRQVWSAPADRAQGVFREDKPRGNPHPATEEKTADTPALSFTYGQLREAGDHPVTLTSNHVPNYGSQQTTTVLGKAEADTRHNLDVRR